MAFLPHLLYARCTTLACALLASFATAQTQGINFTIDTVAGGAAYSAPPAFFDDIRGVAMDSARNMFVTDAARHRIVRISPSGFAVVIGGTGKAGFAGDGGPAELAQFNQPYGMAVDSAGSVFVADLRNARVRKIAVDGVVQTVAGGGSQTPSAVPTRGTNVVLKAPRNVTFDAAGNLYISDFEDHRILLLAPNGNVSLVAGKGGAGRAEASVTAANAQFAGPAGMFVSGDPAVVYVADSGNHAIRRIASGTVTTMPSLSSAAFVNLPVSVSLDASGAFYVTSSGYDHLVKFPIIGLPSILTRQVRDAVAQDAGTVLFVSQTQVRKLTATGETSTVTPVAVPFGGEGVAPAQAVLWSPSAVAVTKTGDLIIADTLNHRLRRVSNGVITTIAGDGEPGSIGDGGPATRARLFAPQAVAADTAGNLYIADTGNHRIRRIAPGGRIDTIAGSGTGGFNGEVQFGLNAQLQSPAGVAVNGAGLVYFSDTGNHRIRLIAQNGIVMTVAGVGQTSELDTPKGIAFDAGGALYIVDSGNRRLRKLTSGGALSTVPASGLEQPHGIAVTAAGVFVSDGATSRVYRVNAAGGIETAAGTGLSGLSGDSGPAAQAQMNGPAGLAADARGNIFVADRFNHRIRLLSAAAAGPAAVTDTGPRITHAASLDDATLAPGMLAWVEGKGIGPARPVPGRLSADGTLETTLGGAQVRFAGTAAAMLYAQENLLNVQVPYELDGLSTAIVEIFKDGELVGQAVKTVAKTSPGIFVADGASGQAIAVNEDSNLNGRDTPAARGSVLTVYATGEGATDPPSQNGRLFDAPYPAPAAPVQASIGGLTAEIVSLASNATSPGLLQLAVRVPRQSATGAQPIQITVGGVASQRGVTVFIR